MYLYQILYIIYCRMKGQLVTINIKKLEFQLMLHFTAKLAHPSDVFQSIKLTLAKK